MVKRKLKTELRHWHFAESCLYRLAPDVRSHSKNLVGHSFMTGSKIPFFAKSSISCFKFDPVAFW